jgi:hypothetical protein
MKDEETKKIAQQEERELQESLTFIKQKSFMKCVILIQLNEMLNSFYNSSEIEKEKDDVNSRIDQNMKNVNGIDSCSLYCRAAHKLQIPLFSSLEIFQKCINSLEERDYIKGKILDDKLITEEEQTYIKVIKNCV